jgi:hypothetical protein
MKNAKRSGSQLFVASFIFSPAKMKLQKRKAGLSE